VPERGPVSDARDWFFRPSAGSPAVSEGWCWLPTSCDGACCSRAGHRLFPSGPVVFLHLFQAILRLLHRCCCCLTFLVAYLLSFLVIFCSLCLYFMVNSLNYPFFCFLTEFFFYLPTTAGWFWLFLSTTDGRDGYPLGFCSVYGTPSSTTFLSCFGSLDGPGHLFDPFPMVLRKALSPLYFIFM
jgi:hypothetical protein